MIPRTKLEWRKWAQRRHEGIDHAGASGRIIEILQDRLDPAHNVLVFLPMAHEVDLRGLAHPRRFVTRTPPDGPLTVHAYDAERETHRWGFEQPAASAAVVDPAMLDVVLVPGVLFGRDGSRLGHGMGYYDELLSRCRSDVWRIGVTFAALVVDALPEEPHDVRMHAIVTEVGINETTRTLPPDASGARGWRGRG